MIEATFSADIQCTHPREAEDLVDGDGVQCNLLVIYKLLFYGVQMCFPSALVMAVRAPTPKR